MKKARITTSIICLVIYLLIAGLVTHEWIQQGCGIESLVTAWLFYFAYMLGFNVLIDLHIREINGK